jgi:predicted acetyltransferase
MLSLIKPDVKYKKKYSEMIEYWMSTGEEPAPWALCEDYSDFEAMVNKLNGYSRGVNIRSDFVPNTTFWLYETCSDKLVGAVNIRHCLNDKLLAYWGHIGYGVRPDERRKGYASQALREALGVCRELGIDRALLSCNKDNIGSAKVILKNGGELENEVELEGRILQRYWIDIV